jgi:signal peptidase I
MDNHENGQNYLNTKDSQGCSCNENSENNATPDGNSPKSNLSLISEIFDYIEIFVFSVCAVMLLFTFAFRLCRVDGESMEKTLFNNEILIVSDIYYSPEANDIVVFHQIGTTNSVNNKPIVKRVIATARHFVKIDYNAGVVYVSDDNIFDENDIIDETSYIYLDTGRWKMSGVMETYVPDGYIFVMGDNRNNSLDSRYEDIGLVDVRRVFGKVLLRISPFSKAGRIY